MIYVLAWNFIVWSLKNVDTTLKSSFKKTFMVIDQAIIHVTNA